MKKTTFTLIALLSSPVYAHDFLTEVLVYSDDYEAGLYNVAVTYNLDEQDLLAALNIAKTKSLKSGIAIKPNSTHNHPGFVHLQTHHKKTKFDNHGKLDPEDAALNSRLGLSNEIFNSRLALEDPAFVGNEKTCGMFDHFSESRGVAVEMCDNYALTNSAQFPHGLIPQFIGPATFTDGVSATEDHHTNYQYADGLNFNCVEVVSKSKSLPGLH